jgi:PAS domain S-box-containing protein
MLQGKNIHESPTTAIAEPSLLHDIFSAFIHGLSAVEQLVENCIESVMITQTQLDGAGPQVVYVNAAFTKMTGYTLDDFRGQSPALLHGLRSDRAVLDRMNHRLRNNHGFFGEMINYRKDGSEFFMEWNIEPLCDELGRAMYFVALQRDVSARKQTEHALKLAETKYRSIFENALEGIFQSTPSGRYLNVNPALARMYGYATPAELMEHLTQIEMQLYVKPERRTEFMRMMQEEGTVSKFESQVYRCDGSVLWISEYARAVRDEDGSVLYYEGTVEDITERKRAEAQIQEQAALLDKARDAIMVLELDGTVRFWNRGAENIYGWPKHEMIGRKFQEFCDVQQHERLFAARTTTATTGEWAGELRQLNHEDREIVVESRWTLVRDETGSPESFLVINTDVTERLRLENQFLQAQRLDSLGMLAGGIAHDLNNVLSPILMASNYLSEKLRDAEFRGMINLLQKSAERGAALVRQVLSFARDVGSERGMVDLGKLVEEVFDMAAQTFPKLIRVERDIAPDLWPATGRNTQLHQVLLNLCVNARDAIGDREGRISITAQNQMVEQAIQVGDQGIEPGRYVVVSVQDDGGGIPAHVQQQIFEPFFTTKSHGKGTGLGLSTVMVIARGHGGLVDFVSREGEGTTFQIYLPATLAIEPAGHHAANTQPPRGNGTVLVVDDEPAILEITRETLESFGYRVITAASGPEALQAWDVCGGAIDLALVDLMMPKMSGVETIRALRVKNYELKIVAVSGLSDDEARRSLGGIATLLPKPFTFNQLLNKLHGMLKAA